MEMMPFELQIPRGFMDPIANGWIVPEGTKTQSVGRALSAKEREERTRKRKAQRAARKRRR